MFANLCEYFGNDVVVLKMESYETLIGFKQYISKTLKIAKQTKANAEDEVDVISRVIKSEISCIPKPKDYEWNYFSLPNIIQWGFIPLFTKRSQLWKS